MRILLTSLLSFLFFWGHTQEILPRFMTEDEKAIVEKGLLNKDFSSFKTPPPGAVRLAAEWEEMQAVIIVWEGFSQILSEIVANLIDDVPVIIVCPNENSVKSYLSNKGIDYDGQVSFYEIPTNSLWVRDFGPNSAYLKETGELVWIDWIYNRPRYQDNALPVKLGEELGIPVYSTDSQPEDLVNTGGNFMSDGMGQGFSSKLVLDENGTQNQFGFSNHSEEDVDGIMEQYMGISNYIKMVNLPYDLIHHIDMHMKLIDEETILVGEYPEGVADGPQIEANIQYILDNFKTSYDRDFNIVRIPMPPAANGNYPDFGGDYRTYANALIANNTILVPTYEEKYDTTALRIWQEIKPGYNVKGIDCNSIIPLSGALHCITKEVAAHDPIDINMKKENTYCANEIFKWEATIQSHIGISEANLFLNIDGNGYNEIPMTNTEGDTYEAELGVFEIGTTIEYYIEATDNGGKIISRPFPGEAGPRVTKIINCNPSTVIEKELTEPNIFPNPASAITCIDLKESYNNINVELFDILGNNVGTLVTGASAQKVFFDASMYNAGTYIVKIEADGNTINSKIIIK